MKKLMILAAAITTAIVTNAGSYSWSVASDWITESDLDESSSFVGNKVYFFDSTVLSSANFIAALATDNAKTAFDSAFPTTGVVRSGDEEGMFKFTGTNLTGYGAPEYVNGYAVLLDAASLDDATYAYVVEYDPVKVTDGVEKSGAKFYQEAVYTGAVGGTGWTKIGSGDVPEPTSGLLLLLGMAGLALRRGRRA